MCGIVALWNRNGAPIDLDALRRGVQALSRRGPDDEGYALFNTRTGRQLQCGGADTDPALGLPLLEDARAEAFDLALGHRRLAIVDLSPAGHQPMATADHGLWIVFNGMIYNFRELRVRLESLGHRFRSRSDTEVVLHAYDQWGPRCVEQFNGMWALAIWDGRRQELFASRDRLGIKPLLSATDGESVVFASELRALRPLLKGALEIDPEGLHHYLSLMKVPAPFTIYREVRKVRPAHSWVARRQSLDVARHWDLEAAPATVGDDDQAVERVHELIEDSVRLHLIADVPTGTLLSGGVDSSVVTAFAAAACRPEPLRTFGLSFPDQPEVDEGPWAERVAAHLATSHHAVRAEADWLALPEFVRLFDEPFAVSSAFGVLRLAQEAARSTKVLLTGDGGDEIFAGYLGRHHEVDQKWDRLDGRRLERLRGARARSVGQWVRWRPLSRWRSVGLRIESLLLSSQAGRDRVFNSRRLIFNEPEKHALYTAEWRARIRAHSSLAWLCSTLPDPGIDRLARWQIHDVRTSLADEMLAKVDGATMPWGIEARVPLLDHRLVELAVNLAGHLKIRRDQGKWILREVGARYLPRDVLDRRKHGFTIPLADWFRGPWSPLLDDWLGDAALRRVGILDPRVVAQIRAYHDAAPNFTTAHMVFTLLCFQMWHDLVHRRG